MGYAKVHEYAFMEVMGYEYPNLTITSVDGDFDVSDIVMPSFTDPLRYAFVDTCFQVVKNSNAGTNWLETGTVGEVRIVDTVTTNEFKVAEMRTDECYVDAGYWRPMHWFPGTDDVHDHIVSGRTFHVILKGCKANKDSLLCRNPYAKIRLYFG